MKHILVASILLIQGCAFLPYPFDQGEYPSPQLVAMVERTRPAARLTTIEFRDSWARYISKVVEVTGTVTRIINKGGAAAVELDNDWASCYFGRKQKPMVGRLHEGQRVTFRGFVHPHFTRGLETCILITSR